MDFSCDAVVYISEEKVPQGTMQELDADLLASFTEMSNLDWLEEYSLLSVNNVTEVFAVLYGSKHELYNAVVSHPE